MIRISTTQLTFLLFSASFFDSSLRSGAFSFVLPVKQPSNTKRNNNGGGSTSSSSSSGGGGGGPFHSGLKLFTTEGYLDQLSTNSQGPTPNFATSDYLNTLSQIVQSSTDYNTETLPLDVNHFLPLDMDEIYMRQSSAEDFLHQLSSQLAQIRVTSTAAATYDDYAWIMNDESGITTSITSTASSSTSSSMFLSSTTSISSISSSTLGLLEGVTVNTDYVVYPIADTLASSTPMMLSLYDGSTVDDLSDESILSSSYIWDQMGPMAVATTSGEEDSSTSAIASSDVNMQETLESLEQKREMIQKQISELSLSDAPSSVDTSSSSPMVVPVETWSEATAAAATSSSTTTTTTSATTTTILNNVDETNASSELSKSLKAMLSEQSYSSPTSSFNFDKSTDATTSALSDSLKSFIKTPSFKPPSTATYNLDSLTVKTPKVFSSVSEVGTNNPWFNKNINSNTWKPKSLTESNPISTFDSTSLNELWSSVSHKVTDAGEASIKAVNEALQARQAALNEGASGSIKTISEATAGTVKTIGDASLSDVASAVISGIKLIATLLLKLIDAILINLGEPTVAQLLTNVQTSITTVVNDATTAVTKTITDLGNLSVKDILQGLISLLVFISKLFLTVLNMLVKYLSGKGASEWVLEATTRLNDQAKILADQTSHAMYDLTHASFTELISSIGAFSQEVANSIVSTMDLYTSDVIVTSGIM